jgi:hypothetical protein
LTNHPREWVWFLRGRLCSGNGKNLSSPGEKGEFLPGDYFGTCWCLLEFSAYGPLNLYYWLWSMRNPAESMPIGSRWYLPLWEDNLFILGSLLLMLCLGDSEEIERDVFPKCPFKSLKPVSGFGLKITTGFQKEEIFLIHSKAIISGQGKEESFSENKARIVYFVSVPSASYQETEERLSFQNTSHNDLSSPDKTLWVGRRYFVDAEDLIRLSEHPTKLCPTFRKVFAMARPMRPKVRLELVE